VARIKNYGIDDLLHGLTSMNVGAMTTKMIEDAEPIMMENVKRYAEKHRVSGAMIKSIKSTGVKERKGGKYLVVRPTGKDKKGVRNMEKMAYLEYGTVKQPATPIITPAVKNAEVKIERVWREDLGVWMDKHTWRY
jgi:HK97 gp10 family phage protein